MTDSSLRSPRVLELAEEFLERYRRGERPPLGEYAARYPELADEIREVFPAIAMMERIALADESIEGRRLPPGPAMRPGLEQLGDFRILREVGRGGMGVVFEAEQVSLGRHVALKVLPDRLLADPKQRGRFEREAKAAARLHHTNIVPVFGVGEDEGTPYYAMQFIPGLGLDQVMRELKRQRAGARPEQDTPAPAESSGNPTITVLARSLLAGRLGAEGRAEAVAEDAAIPARDGSSPAAPVAARSGEVTPTPSSGLLLGFSSGERSTLDDSPTPTYWRGVARIGSQVADALAYAHSQGILHRDIKPSNLLLDTRGTVWVTDFGLAKVEDQEGLTHTGDILGTLRYMPPEAFEGRHDARGDVYSLGLSLYEMLAFRPAFDEVDRHQLVRQVTTGEPPRLRTLNPEVPRDLETVVHKAIEREPSHRYPTAAALAEDLRRYMEDRPILARRASESEKFRRWCRRNPTPAVLLATLFVVFWAGFGLVTWKWREAVAEREAKEAERRKAVESAELAERQRGRAEDREGQAIEAVRRFRDVVASEPELRNSPKLEPLRRRLLSRPLAFFKGLRDRLQADRDTRPESLFRLAVASDQLGELTDEIGDRGDALIAYRESLEIARKLVADHPDDARFQGLLADGYEHIGVLLTETGKPAEALEALVSSQATFRKLAEADPSVEIQSHLALIYGRTGDLLSEAGKVAEARKAYESGLAILRKLAEADPSNKKVQNFLAAAYRNMGSLLRDTGKPAEALKACESSVAILRKLVEADPSVAEYQNFLATSYVAMANVLGDTGKPAEALKVYESALAIARKLTAAYPTVTEYQSLLGLGYLNIGVNLAAAGRPAAALAAFESAVATFRKLAAAWPSVPEFQSRLASSHGKLGFQLASTGRLAEARKAFEAGLPVLRKLARDPQASPGQASELGAVLNNLAMGDLNEGRFHEARERLREAIVWQRKALALNPSHVVYRQFLINHYNNLRNAALALNDLESVAEAEREMTHLRDSDPSKIDLDARLAAIIKGDRQPDGETDRLALAQRAYEKALYGSAARLQSEALAANPALINNLQAQHRYNAACSAALAGCGKGKDDPPLGDDARARLRKQALDWLNLEVAVWARFVEAGPPQARAGVVEVLTHWKGDPDLAGIRDAAALAKLDDGERAAFLKLWIDVDALLKKADGGR